LEVGSNKQRGVLLLNARPIYGTGQKINQKKEPGEPRGFSRPLSRFAVLIEMKKLKHIKALLCLAAAMALGAAMPAKAGTAVFDFNTDPTGILTIFSNTETTEWRPTGGVDGGGYLSLTDAVNDARATVVFDDFDEGTIVKAFTFSMDIRTGGGTASPADGFSVNYARLGDPVIETGDGFAASPGGEANLPEEGTTTGLGIGFDTWDSGSGDVIGISVRVDNELIAQYPFPTLNGALDDLTSLQTGPRVEEDDPEARLAALGWAPFSVELKEDGKLSIHYKNAPVVEDLQTAFFPSPGRLVLAARTGGANAYHHVDNIQITTVPSDQALVTGLVATASGFTVNIQDSGQSVLDPATLQLTLNGTPITADSVEKEGLLTTIRHQFDSMLASGSAHTIGITFSDTLGAQIQLAREFTVPVFTILPPELAVDPATVDRTAPGFRARFHQMEAGRSNFLPAPLLQLHGGLIDPATGQPYDNLIDTFLFGEFEHWEGDVFIEEGVINYNQDARDNPEAGAGNFQPDKPIPGIPGFTMSTDNIVMRASTYLELEQGFHRMGVNSDDGFIVSAAQHPNELFHMRLGLFDGGRGAADTLFEIFVEEAGIYPFALYWWEGTGGANVEWFHVDAATGDRILINDPSDPRAIPAFRTAAAPAYVEKVFPFPGTAGLAVTTNVVATLVDAATAVDTASVQLAVNGQPVEPTVAKTEGVTTVTYNPGEFASLSSPQISLTYSQNGETRTVEWSFGVGFSAQTFFVEAEDFDFDGGQHQAAASTLTYNGGAYEGLGAIHGVDYFEVAGGDDPEGAGLVYRSIADPERRVGMEAITVDQQRGPDRIMTVDYKIGWNDAGDWRNYTRTFPENTYNVYARLASGHENPEMAMSARLDEVTAGVGTVDQTLAPLGQFHHPSPTGGWNTFISVPLRDATGGLARVDLSGGRTIRFTVEPGALDVNYLAFVPAGEDPGPIDEPEFTSVSQEGDNIRIEWVGAGTLESAPTVEGPWTAVTGQTSPAVIPMAQDQQFFRIRQ
jgi:hypothetical protein